MNKKNIKTILRPELKKSILMFKKNFNKSEALSNSSTSLLMKKNHSGAFIRERKALLNPKFYKKGLKEKVQKYSIKEKRSSQLQRFFCNK